MIQLARRLTCAERMCRFEVSDFNHLTKVHYADIVSAASLLFVLPDPLAGIRQLWRCVRPGGALLIIETTTDMVPAQVRQARQGVRSGRGLALTLWALARRGRIIDPSVFDAIVPASRECKLLLNGLVQAWVFTKEAA
jgi:ubiquinone/menaquinone biosynthesis C-methylase UbiE